LHHKGKFFATPPKEMLKFFHDIILGKFIQVIGLLILLLADF